MKFHLIHQLVIVCGLGLVLAGCSTDDQTAKRGSYTAARHKALGSNIMQPASADNMNSTYSPAEGTGANMSGSNQSGAGFGVRR